MSNDKTCFIITPIGGNNTETRRATNGLIEAVIVPVLLNYGFSEEKIYVSHQMTEGGSINKQIITKILDSDLAIANLTNLNANVMYELAIRHAARKPVIIICEEGTKLPFDIVDERTIFYINDMQGVVQLRLDIQKMLPGAIGDVSPDNPIYRVIDSKLIKEGLTDDFQKFMFDQIEKLQSSISILANNAEGNNITPQRPVTSSFKIYGSLISEEQLKTIDIFDILSGNGRPTVLYYSTTIRNSAEITISITFEYKSQIQVGHVEEQFKKIFKDVVEVTGVEKINNISF
ncbi:hypothetical protein QYF50_05850 [Paenibacillus vini]|uniref:hypothetical protein n=1 Tax=Paenibacillus vini TaxID=1476024 RepID=UPI0025B69845|nr:hypothetical protein [Paenibacillus vini]MDN4067413.1 hypothetical protein [Paenibacillus vini]